MAACDRQNPNLDDFVGLNWSCWVDRVNILSSQVNVEDSSKYGRKCETMTLRKEDMHTFGHCPAHDELYLVVCSHCGQVVKPQAFEKHYERRHGPLTKTCGQSATLAPQQRPRPARPTSNHSSSRERQKDSKCHEASNSTASPVHQHRTNKAQKQAVSFPSVEKFLPQENAPLPHSSSSPSSSSPRPRVPPCHSGPLPPGHSSCSPSQRPVVPKPPAVQSSESSSPLRGTRTYSRIQKSITKKECELNKQCGGLLPERKKLCSQELTCNTDTTQQQQKALGRTKTFDQQAEEQKSDSAGRDMEQLLVTSTVKEQLDPFDEKITTQSSPPLIGNSHNLRKRCPPIKSGDFVEEDDHTVEVEELPQYPLKQNLLSGEESEDDEQDEATDLPATAWHPKPLGLCTFGCRTLGCSIFTFNRRLHHLRFALSTMLERHVNTHVWKKMPQIPSGLRSCHVTAVGSPVRTGATPLKSPGSLSLQSTSLGQSKTSQYNSLSIKPPSSTASARLVPVRRRNPARLRKEEAQMAAKLSHGGEDKSSKYIRDPPLNEKGQPHIPSSQGPVNGSFSHGKKPCPPLLRVRPPGIQQEVASYDHRGLAQKRKGSNESLLISSSLSKCQRLSSTTQRGERISGMCKPWAWEKHPSPKDQ